MNENSNQKTEWCLIFLALLIGVSVAGYVGKTPPAIPSIRIDLTLSLVMAGWVVSIFCTMGSFTGLVAGMFADRVGRAKIVVFSLGCISFGSFLGANSHSLMMLLLSRIIEGTGYIGAMAILPALIAGFASDQHRAFAVSLHSSVTPLGMAIAMVAAPPVIHQYGWRYLWWITGMITILFMVFSLIAFRKVDAKTLKNKNPFWSNIKKTTSSPGPWLISICFMTYTFQWYAIMVWLPTFAIEERGLDLKFAAALAAAAVSINIFGNLFGAWLVHWGIHRWILISVGTFMMGILSLFIFPDILPDIIRFGLVLVFSFLGALQPPAIMASVPIHSPSTAQLGSTSGIVYQGSQIGLLLGPPAVAWFVTLTETWAQTGYFLFIGTIINLTLVQWMRTRERNNSIE
ncbi:MAG: MFS transporter [Pseudomonadota bacterium]|nr:MFS transporter [Pseudomonadota bacterium]